MISQSRAYYHSPIGIIEIVGTERVITALNFVRRRRPGVAEPNPLLRAAAAQLDEYFRGKRTHFTLALRLDGTDFEKMVWRRLVKVPYGQTTTYADVAGAVGRPKAARAVGQANHRNPISIIVPCHRVIGSDGRLVGYGSGLWRKRWLLDHERRNSRQSNGPHLGKEEKP